MKKLILLLIDIQKEYITPGRPFYLNGIESSLAKCRELLSFARENGWGIIHVQHSNGVGAARFNPETPYFNFVDGFEPLGNERHFVKKDFSCYSNEAFSTYLHELYQTYDEIKMNVVGYNSVMCCLSTLEEARRKGHKMHFVRDATLAKSVGDLDEKAMHEVMLSIYAAKGLATIVQAEDIMENPTV